MLSKIYSGALIGVEAAPVEVEVNSGESGEPRTFMVGLPDAAVKESQDRVNSALANSGFSVPHTKMTINLAPGDIRKEDIKAKYENGILRVSIPKEMPQKEEEHHIEIE